MTYFLTKITLDRSQNGCYDSKVVIESGVVEAMAASVNKKSDSDTDKSQLSKQDLLLMLAMCTELVNLCAKLTGRIDPAAAAMLAYVRDDLASESNLELQ